MGEERTEQATPHHRQESRKKGQVAKSTDLVSIAVLLIGLSMLRSYGPSTVEKLRELASRQLTHLASAPTTVDGVTVLFRTLILDGLMALGPIIALVMMGSMASSMAQVGLLFSTQALKPDFTRIDPLKGFTRIFSGRGVFEVFKSIAKAGICFTVAWQFLMHERGVLLMMPMMDSRLAGTIAVDMIFRLCMRLALVLAIMAIIDYVYQRWSFERSIRMTKQQVKEEYKQMEGDPIIRSALRQRRRELLRNRMMQAVPQADVVVTNPTHYAVALRYDPDVLPAPQVVAKGQRLMAQRIKQIAAEHGVPVVENKPVARMLYSSTEVGDMVPLELYQAVAEILAFVYRLRDRRVNVHA